MKVKITLNLELPELYKTFTPQELRQALFDNVVGAIAWYHTNSLLFLEPETEAKKEHQLWFKITKQPAWDYTL